jgi:hypothetical protein
MIKPDGSTFDRRNEATEAIYTSSSQSEPYVSEAKETFAIQACGWDFQDGISKERQLVDRPRVSIDRRKAV